MNRTRFVSLGLIAVFLASPGVASAECQRKGSLGCGSGTKGVATGDSLQVSRGGDFGPFGSGGALQGGDRILTGATDATLTLGSTCQAPVGAGSLVTIKKSNKQTCASVTEQPAQSVAQVEAPVVDPVVIAAGLAAAAAVGVGVALSGNDGNGGTVSAQ